MFPNCTPFTPPPTNFRFRIPTGFHPSAQGCPVGGTTLGNVSKYFLQPQRGCITPRRAGYGSVLTIDNFASDKRVKLLFEAAGSFNAVPSPSSG